MLNSGQLSLFAELPTTYTVEAKRERAPRSNFVPESRLTRRLRTKQTAIYGLRDPTAPTDRAACIDGPRPCKWTDCRYHLWALDGDDRPGRRHTAEDVRHSVVVKHTEHTCALDVADAHPDGMSPEQVAVLLGVVDERVRQIEAVAKESMQELLQLDHHQRGDCLGSCVWCDGAEG